MNKILTLNQVDGLIEQYKNNSTVLVGGVFDILHIGHVRFLAEAKKYGDFLIVFLESDARVKELKGTDRPIHSQAERAEVLSELTCIDVIIPLPYFSTDQEYQDLTSWIKPKIIAITSGDPYQKQKQQQADDIKAKLITIPHLKTPSTTQLAKLLDLEKI